MTRCQRDSTQEASGSALTHAGVVNDAKLLEPDLLDRALADLHRTDVEYGSGLANHGPMAAEALENLGRPDRIAPFLALYSKRLRARDVVTPLPWDRWKDAVGDEAAASAAVLAFEKQLRVRPYAEVLAEVVPTLAPGLVGAAFHGVIRAGHAVRAVQARDNAVRRAELAHGLGYWAARSMTLPGAIGSNPRRGHGVASLLAAVPRIESPKLEGTIARRFGALSDLPGFAEAVAAFDLGSASPSETIDAVVAEAAQGYLRAPDGRRRFVFLHVITGTAATRRMLPFVDDETAQSLACALVHGAAAVWATHGSPQLGTPTSVERLEPATLIERVATSRDDHAIKIVDAVLSEHARGGPDSLLAVASMAVG